MRTTTAMSRPTGLKGAVASIFQPHSHDAADSLDSVGGHRFPLT